MRIYTRGGDDGSTQLLGPDRLPKDALRVTAYGEIDELNATLGLALLQALPLSLRQELGQLQSELFTLGAELATPPGMANPNLPRVPDDWPGRLETWIDQHDAALPPLRLFVLPGGSPAAAALHLSRTVCRRAERAIVRLNHSEPVRAVTLRYVNRLSDYLFVAARVANHAANHAETYWPASETP